MIIKTRKRGDTLNQEIFAATLKCVKKYGVAETTFAKIALLARTSRSVLYRYWARPFDLIIDAFLDSVRGETGGLARQDFNSGNLRTDLINLLQYFVKPAQSLNAEISRMLMNEWGGNNPHTQELRILAENADLAAMDKIIAQAQERKEIQHEPAQIVKLLPFEVLRFRLLSNSIVDDQYITQLVDKIILPAMKNT